MNREVLNKANEINEEISYLEKIIDNLNSRNNGYFDHISFSNGIVKSEPIFLGKDFTTTIQKMVNDELLKKHKTLNDMFKEL